MMPLTIIGVYRSAAENPDVMELLVSYERSLYELNGSDWLIKKLLMSGEIILNTRILYDVEHGEYLDVLSYQRRPSGQEVISRSTVYKEYDEVVGGGIYFIVKASCLKKNYTKHAYDLLHMITHWELINKCDMTRSEKFQIVSIHDVVPCQFYIPASWMIRHSHDNNPLVSRYVFLHNLGDQNIGAINLYVFRADLAQTAVEILEASFDRIASENDVKHTLYKLRKKQINHIYNLEIDEVYTASAEVFYEQKTILIEIKIVKTKRAWYYIEVAGPRANVGNLYWEANQRCLEMIVDSLHNLKLNKRPNFEAIRVEQVQTLEGAVRESQ